MNYLKKLKCHNLSWTIGILFLYQTNNFNVLANSVSFSGGEGTLDSPYLMSKPADFEALRLQVQKGNTYKDVYFELTQSIDFKNYDNDSDPENGNFNAIGSPANPFSGHLDGKGYTISNLDLSGTETYLSFIGSQHGGSLRNLQFENIDIQGTTVNKGVQYLSVVVGEANQTNLKNISVTHATLHSQADNGDRYLSTVAADIYHSRLENILSQNNTLTGYASGCGVAYYSDDQTYFKNLFFNSNVETLHYKSPLVCYPDAENFENLFWNEDRIHQPDSAPNGAFNEEDVAQGRLDEILSDFDFKEDWTLENGILQLVPEYRKNQLQIEGNVIPTIINISLPNISPSFVLNPNAPTKEEQFIAPTLKVINEGHAPLRVSVRSFTSVNQLLNDVMPDFYADWNGLNKEQSKNIALSLVTKPQEGWLALENETYYAAEQHEKAIGTIKPNQTVSFDFQSLHGLSFSELKQPIYQLIFVFDLLS